MSYSGFRKDAQGKLEDYRPAVDAEALWAALEPQVAKRKKRRLPLLFFLFFLGAACSLWWFFSSSEMSPIPQVSTMVDSSIVPYPTLANTPLVAKEEAKNKNQTPTDFRSLVSTTKNIKTALPQVPKTKEEAPLLIQKGIKMEKKTLSAAKEMLSRTSSNYLVEKLVTKEIALLSFPTGKLNTSLTDIEKAFLQTRKKVTLGIGLKSGWNRLNQELKPSHSSSTDYLQDRSSTETELEVLHVGVGIQLLHRRQWYLRSGLEYARWSTRFVHSSKKMEVEKLVNGVQRIYLDASTGDTTYVKGMVPRFYSEETISERYNVFHVLQLPLVGAYRFQEQQWSFGIEVGVLLNAYLSRKGTILSPDGEYYDLQKDTEKWYKTGLGFGAITALQVGFSPRARWELYVSPEYRVPIKVSTINNPVGQQFSSLGLSAGIWYRW